MSELMESSAAALSAACAGLAALITDAVVEDDRRALRSAQRGLQRLYARQHALPAGSPDHHELRGRMLTLIDIVHWTLQRPGAGAVIP